MLSSLFDEQLHFYSAFLSFAINAPLVVFNSTPHAEKFPPR